MIFRILIGGVLRYSYVENNIWTTLNRTSSCGTVPIFMWDISLMWFLFSKSTTNDTNIDGSVCCIYDGELCFFRFISGLPHVFKISKEECIGTLTSFQ